MVKVRVAIAPEPTWLRMSSLHMISCLFFILWIWMKTFTTIYHWHHTAFVVWRLQTSALAVYVSIVTLVKPCSLAFYRVITAFRRGWGLLRLLVILLKVEHSIMTSFGRIWHQTLWLSWLLFNSGNVLPWSSWFLCCICVTLETANGLSWLIKLWHFWFLFHHFNIFKCNIMIWQSQQFDYAIVWQIDDVFIFNIN